MQSPNPSLIKYIEKHISKGFDLKHIKRRLAEAGHPVEAIEDAAAYVLENAPSKRKRIPKFMVFYGFAIIVVLVFFGWFIWSKAVQQIDYTEIVKDIRKNQSYAQMSDVQLLKLAAGGDANACGFVQDHMLLFACTEKYWERNDCSFETFINEDVDACWDKLARTSKNSTFCLHLAGAGRISCLFDIAEVEGDYRLCIADVECLKKYAIKHESPAVCSEIDISFELEDCYDSLALKLNNKLLCQNGTLYCQLNFSMTSEEQVAYVRSVAESFGNVAFNVGWILPDRKTTFITTSAVKTGNLDVCTLLDDIYVDISPTIKQVSLRTACMARVVYVKNDSSLCSRFPSEKEKNICLSIFSNGCTDEFKAICDRLG